MDSNFKLTRLIYREIDSCQLVILMRKTQNLNNIELEANYVTR